MEAPLALIAAARSIVAELNILRLQRVHEACIVAEEQATTLRAGEEHAAALKPEEARAKVATAREATDQCKLEAANRLKASLIDSAIPTEALMEVFTLAQEAANH